MSKEHENYAKATKASLKAIRKVLTTYNATSLNDLYLEHMRLAEEIAQQEKDRQEVLDTFKEWDLGALEGSARNKEGDSDDA